jgi:hypothetical protein
MMNNSNGMELSKPISCDPTFARRNPLLALLVQLNPSVLAVFTCAMLLPGQNALSQSRVQARESNTRHQMSAQREAKEVVALAPACGEELLTDSSTGVRLTAGLNTGATDPMAVPPGRYQLFPSQGLATFYPGGPASTRLAYFHTDSNADLKLSPYDGLTNFPYDPYGSGPPQVVATAGRTFVNQMDTMVTAQREGNAFAEGTRVNIGMHDTRFGGIQSTGYLPDTLLPRQSDSNDFLAIATGVLDLSLDGNGNRHEDVAVARVVSETSDHANYNYRVDVLNYSKGEGRLSAPEITSATFSELAPGLGTDANANTLANENILSLAVGDFLGVDSDQIALAVLTRGQLVFHLFRYETVNGKHDLVELSRQAFPINAGGIIPGDIGKLRTVGTISTAVGDFEGIGSDQLAVGLGKFGNSNYGASVLVFKFNPDFKPQLTSNNFSVYPLNSPGNSYPRAGRPRIELAAGQFFLSADVHYGRKQLVLAANRGQQSIQMWGLSLLDNGKNTSNFATFNVPSNAGPLYSLASGHFQGIYSKLPVAAIALGRWNANTTNSNQSSYDFSTYQVGDKAITLKYTNEQNIHQAPDPRTNFQLLAFDRLGHSRYLGAPVHLQVLKMIDTDFVMQEPPKHGYWDENQHQFVNFTRYDRNNVHLSKSGTASMATDRTDHSNFDIGGSAAISAGATLTNGLDLGIAKGSTTSTVDVTAKSAYDYNEQEAKYNSTYRERTVTSTGQTDRDDFLKGSLQTMDIWRYRVYGAPSDTTSNAYYEIILPGDKIEFAGAGSNYSWYQPVHENGNVLSYPSAFGPAPNRLLPADMGSYILPNGKEEKSPQVPAQLEFFDGSSGTTELNYSEEVNNGGSFSYSHAITGSADIKASYTVEATALGNGAEGRVCGSAEVHSGYSWGGSTTSNETTKTETAVVLNRAAGQRNVAYPFYPIVYTTQDGTVKLSFSAPNPADRNLNPAGAGTWATIYGGKPDPALNLPGRLVPSAAGSGELEKWEPNRGIDRKHMRGLFFRHSKLLETTGTYPLLAFNPTDGETIRIEPRIYNFSTAQPAVDTTVEFQVIPYDDALNSEICETPLNGGPGVTTGLVCPRAARIPIGKIVVPRLEPRQFTCVEGFDDPKTTGCANSAYFNWNTKGFGPSGGNASDYRVYVVLNRNGAPGSEIYGLESHPVAITAISDSTPRVITAQGLNLATGDFVIIGGVRGVSGIKAAYQVTRMSNDEFALDESTAGSPYTGGGTATQMDPGQNNEGYGYITIASSLRGANLAIAKSSPRDYLETDALEAVPEIGLPRLTASRLGAQQGVPLQLRFTAHSTTFHRGGAHMLLYDGEPGSGSVAIADQIIHPGSHGREGSSIWFRWTPATAGTHQLYAVLLEGDGVQQAAGELTVDVESIQ